MEGIARVIAAPEEGERLQPGEILVTTVTNMGWTPLFPRAAAVVTDMGAPLSHASIVARELGIPAVVGSGNATMRLHDGDGSGSTVSAARWNDAAAGDHRRRDTSDPTASQPDAYHLDKGDAALPSRSTRSVTAAHRRLGTVQHRAVPAGCCGVRVNVPPRAAARSRMPVSTVGYGASAARS